MEFPLVLTIVLVAEVTIRVCDAEKAITEVGDFEVETIDLLRVQLKRSAETYTSSELRNIRIQERMIEKSVSTVHTLAVKEPSEGFTAATVAIDADDGLWLGTFQGDRIVFIPDRAEH